MEGDSLMRIVSDKLLKRVESFLFQLDGFSADEVNPEIERVLNEMLDDADKNHAGTLRQSAIRDIASYISAEGRV